MSTRTTKKLSLNYKIVHDLSLLLILKAIIYYSVFIWIFKKLISFENSSFPAQNGSSGLPTSLATLWRHVFGLFAFKKTTMNSALSKTQQEFSFISRSFEVPSHGFIFSKKTQWCYVFLKRRILILFPVFLNSINLYFLNENKSTLNFTQW